VRRRPGPAATVRQTYVHTAARIALLWARFVLQQ
jgi:hypothetical protein